MTRVPLRRFNLELLTKFINTYYSLTFQVRAKWSSWEKEIPTWTVQRASASQLHVRCTSGCRSAVLCLSFSEISRTALKYGRSCSVTAVWLSYKLPVNYWGSGMYIFLLAASAALTSGLKSSWLRPWSQTPLVARGVRIPPDTAQEVGAREVTIATD